MSAVTNGHGDLPMQNAGTAASSGRYPRSSSSGGSLPSPAMVTSEARQVLEAFLQRTQSMDRGSTGSISALVPRHLEVIQEIRHTRRKRSACTGDSVGSMDALVVESHMPSNSSATLDHMEVQHRAERDGRHVTDIALHFHSNEDAPGVERVVRTHVTHPQDDDDASKGACAAKVVTEESNEIFIDATMSRQVSTNDGLTHNTSLSQLTQSDLRGPTPTSQPSSRAIDTECEQSSTSPAFHQQVAVEAAATGKAWKKRRKSFRALTRWIRNRSESRGSVKNFTVGQGDGATSNDVADYLAAHPTQWDRPPFQTMESYSSSTSSTTSSYGAPQRSLVHRDVAAEERKRRRKRKERKSFKWQRASSGAEGGSGSIFHQLYATIRYHRKRLTPQDTALANSDPTLLDEHAQTVALEKVR